MSSKRKRTDLDDSDEEEPALGKQVLPVANLPADFNGVPEDGLQYLFTVRRDARLMPHVTRAENPYEIEDKPHEDLLTLSITNDVLPSEKWRDTFLKRFKNFRKNCVQPTIHITNNPPRSTLKVIPDRKDREAWWAYLTGRPESEWNPPKKVKGQNARNQGYGRGMRAYSLETQINLYQETQGAGPSREDVHMNEEREVEQVVAMDPTESLPTPSGTPAPPDRHPGTSASEQVFGEETNLMNITQPEPTPVIMRHMDHRYSLHLLMYFGHWINLYLERPIPRICPITETHARWMFVLLSKVDDILSADEMSTLRSLARSCASLIKDRLQNRLPEADEVSHKEVGELDRTIGESSCWMIIATVAGMWGQKDLWMDAKEMLSGVSTGV